MKALVKTEKLVKTLYVVNGTGFEKDCYKRVMNTYGDGYQLKVFKTASEGLDSLVGSDLLPKHVFIDLEDNDPNIARFLKILKKDYPKIYENVGISVLSDSIFSSEDSSFKDLTVVNYIFKPMWEHSIQSILN